jgi:probable HAF family extracellular repeat protein
MLNQIEGDVRSAALGINEDGQIVGFSRTSGAVLRAVIWANANATIQNLNDLVSTDSPYLLIAGDINNSGNIGGTSGDGAGFLATPNDSNSSVGANGNGSPLRIAIPERLRMQLQQRWGLDD